jgi:hypothetical protein
MSERGVSERGVIRLADATVEALWAELTARVSPAILGQAIPLVGPAGGLTQALEVVALLSAAQTKGENIVAFQGARYVRRVDSGHIIVERQPAPRW